MERKPNRQIQNGYVLLPREVDMILSKQPPLNSKMFNWILTSANFKDNGKIKRGQLFTTRKDMAQAMSWYEGYRKKTPKDYQITTAYKALEMKNLIKVKPSTRGMVITVIDYEEYQNPSSYKAGAGGNAGTHAGAHTGAHDESDEIPF